ncbi:hypothetical protein K474DRAFT_1589318 [Panus rudis PR-1116 ss-1]|nr:hypothetical protein K474DRAFT_1589318 [Panus rudis PR-1116 ss-1]
MTKPDNIESDTSSSPSSSHTRPRPLDFFHTDDIENPLPSPPYRRVPSSSQVLLDSFPEQSPAYRSRSNFDLTSTDNHDMVELRDEKRRTTDDDHTYDQKTKPSVHYPEDVRSPELTSARSGFMRYDEGGGSGSRTPSLAGTDDDDDDEDYDWSGEEDLVDEEAKFEQQMGVKKQKSGWGFKRFFTLLFSSLIGSTFLSGLIITPALLIHFFWFKPHPTDHRRFVKDNVEAWLFWAGANLTISWYLALLVDIVPTVIRLFVSLTWGHVSESIKNKLELYNSVKDNIKPVFYAASGWVSWVILFEHIYKLFNADDESLSRASYTARVYDAIEFLFFFALVICAQRMLSHAIAFSFHRTAFRERLESLTHALKVIERLRLYRPKRHAYKSSFGFGRSTPVLSAFSPFGGEKGSGSRGGTPTNSRPGSPERQTREPLSANDGYSSDPDATLVKKKNRKGKQRTSWLGGGETTEPEADQQRRDHNLSVNPHAYPPSSATPSPLRSGAQTPKRKNSAETEEGAAELVQQAATTAAKALKTAVLHDARNIKGKDNDDLGGLVWNVTSAHEAKRLARSIYMAFKSRHRTYLLPSDFYPAFKTHEEAEQAFRVFDKDNNGDISRAEIKTTLLKVYKERRFLSRSMRDIGQALKTLDHILLFFAMVILFFISLSVFDVSVGDSLTSLYSVGIAASFIFKNAASNAFDAIMFLFVTHPFDTGDRCFIDEENLVVKKMGLFATIFTRVDGTETYYFNSMLFNKFITNARRSGKTAENLTMQVAWRTPLEKLDALEKCLNDWLATEENRWFDPNTSVTLQKIEYQRHLELTIGIAHNGNWQDWGLRCARKTAFHAAVNYYCRQLGIVAHEAPLPVAYADPETMDYTPSSPLPYDDDGEPYSPSPEVHAADASGNQKRQVMLGFTPPPDKPISGVRARKSKSKKSALRAMGADG